MYLLVGDIFQLIFQFLGLYMEDFFFCVLFHHSTATFFINSLNLYGSFPVFNKIKSRVNEIGMKFHNFAAKIANTTGCIWRIICKKFIMLIKKDF